MCAKVCVNLDFFSMMTLMQSLSNMAGQKYKRRHAVLTMLTWCEEQPQTKKSKTRQNNKILVAVVGIRDRRSAEARCRASSCTLYKKESLERSRTCRECMPSCSRCRRYTMAPGDESCDIELQAALGQIRIPFVEIRLPLGPSVFQVMVS